MTEKNKDKQLLQMVEQIPSHQWQWFPKGMVKKTEWQFSTKQRQGLGKNWKCGMLQDVKSIKLFGYISGMNDKFIDGFISFIIYMWW